MDNYLDSLNSQIIDVLKEVGNIGAGNAATALAQMLNKKVDMRVPKINLLDLPSVPELIGGAENMVSSVFFEIDGDIDGSIMFLLDIDSAKTLIRLIMQDYDGETFDEMTRSIISEIGNILSGAYVSSLSALTGLTMKISVPSLAVDMAGAILSVPAIQLGQVSDNILIIQTEFFEGNDNVTGYFFLLPEMDSYYTLLNSLGVTHEG